MEMSQEEIRSEDAGNLRRLAQSPGWAVVKTRLQQLLVEREREKAAHLRRNDAHKATMTQGQVDGLTEAMVLLAQLIEEAKVETKEEQPAY